MVNFAVLLVFAFRNEKSSTMISFAYRSLPVTVGIGGCSSVPPNFGPGFSRSVTPSSCDRKSRCHQARRNSPSVMPSRPIASCFFATARIARSWISRSRLSFSSSLGRKRLPTWSARNGGFMNARMLPSRAAVNILFASETEKAEHWIPLLERALPRDRILLRPEAPIDVALVATPPPGTLETLKDVKLIQSLWMGVEKLLADPALPKGVPLARLVDPGMVAAMSETVLAHADLAVFEPEPMPADQALWRHPQVTITPHAAALTDSRTALPKIVENIERLRSGRPLLNVVDLEVGY